MYIISYYLFVFYVFNIIETACCLDDEAVKMAIASVYTADFQRPKSVPGYGGFTPTIQFSNGCTYGAATRRFYESSRLEELSGSIIQSQRKNNYCINTSRKLG